MRGDCVAPTFEPVNEGNGMQHTMFRCGYAFDSFDGGRTRGDDIFDDHQ